MENKQDHWATFWLYIGEEFKAELEQDDPTLGKMALMLACMSGAMPAEALNIYPTKD